MAVFVEAKPPPFLTFTAPISMMRGTPKESLLASERENTSSAR